MLLSECLRVFNCLGCRVGWNIKKRGDSGNYLGDRFQLLIVHTQIMHRSQVMSVEEQVAPSVRTCHAGRNVREKGNW